MTWFKDISQATPNGCLVSGPVDFQKGMGEGGNCHYIMSLSDEMFKTIAISQA